MCHTADFTVLVDALWYSIDPEVAEMVLAYSTMLFGRNIAVGRAIMCSIMTLTIGHNRGMGDAEYGEIYDIYFLPAYLRLFRHATMPSGCVAMSSGMMSLRATRYLPDE